IDPEIERNRGHIVKTTGDGLLVEFASAQDAVRSAIDFQAEMVQRERDRPEDERIQYRVGINVGDVVFDDGDIFGDGVNVASRLESLAEPGGVCVSDSVYQTLQDRLTKPFRDLGSQRVKNISRAIRVWQWTPNAPVEEAEIADAALTQRVQFCTASDGVQIAYASVGTGFPLFKAPNWLNHIEYEWRSPVWGPAFAALAKNHKLVRFDQRGGGLSDWDVDEISENSMVADMATVAEAAGLESFALLGISQGCAFSIRYAVEHPEQVRCLVLFGGFTRGRLMRNSEEALSFYEAAQTMIRAGWGSPNPVYRHFFTSSFIPDATPEQGASFDELQRVSITPENAERIYAMYNGVDVSDLAQRITAPTLVMHCEGDRTCPLDEGRRMAALIPDARFVTLDGNNHVVLEGTPALDRFITEISTFLQEIDC
ncbi:MAG: alpha/beta fold hydrolase, partial [Alphaproteobacteria bacterium]|nr:alpha/beta fold hydrolase [Alphaproteobacteria bacterium]